jgi:phthiocerol/phenolphthiocerol synthesis type-I polyketide synthase D
VSAFGFGGTNAHVVVEQGPPVSGSVGLSVGSGVSSLVVSGKSVARVGLWASVLADWLESPVGASVGLADVAHTLNHHRSRFARFGTVCARDREGAVAGLRALAEGRPGQGVVVPHEGSCGPGRVFVYSGQGSQWAGMGARLLAEEPLFAAAVDDLEPVFVEQVGFSLRGVLAGGEPVSGIERIQPVLVGLQLALTALWRGYGVEPDAVIGHSMGEVTAAVVAGALSVAEGLRVIATRSRLMSRLSGQGAMALVELDAEATQELIGRYPGVGLAVYASPRQSVIAGAPEQVDAVVAEVSAGNRLARRIEVDVASHHRIIDPVLGELRVALADLAPRSPVIPVFSTTAGDGSVLVFDGQYWAANLRQPVRFSQAIAAAAEQHATFIEISPHPLLTHAITDTVESVSRSERVVVTSAMNRDDDSTLFFHMQLAAVGVEPASDGRLVNVPSAPWQHSSFWIADRSATWGTDNTHPLVGIHTEIPLGSDHVWQADVGTDVCPWLADHRVYGQPIMPGTGYAEIVLAAGAEALDLPVEDLTVKRLEIEQMLVLDRHTRITTQLTRRADDDIRVEVYSRSAQGDWRRHAVARIEPASDAVRPVCGMSDVESDGTAVAPADLYAALRRSGQHHGPAFAALSRVTRLRGGGSVTEIVLPEEASDYPGCRVHPVMFDAALQSLVAAMPDSAIGEAAEATYLPVSFETIRVFGKVGRYARCHAELIGTANGAPGALGRVTLTSEDGTPTAEIMGIYARRVERRTVPLPLEQKVFETAWAELPGLSDVSPTTLEPAGSWLVLSDDRDSTSEAEDFVAKWRSSSRRVVSANLTDEPAVLASFAETAADPDRPPTGVVIFLGHDPLDSTDPHAALKKSRDSIWYVSAVVRAIVGGWHGRSPRLWLVTRRGLAVDDGPGDPAIAALKGLVRVLAYEHPELNTTLVDLDGECDAAEAIQAEAAAGTSDDVIARRGKRRFSERLVRASLDEGVREPVIRADGSYIVTGGLGGIGMVVAEWLVDRGAARVVLNGRSAPGEEQREILTRLEERAEIAVVTGDIASAGVAEQVVAAAEATGLTLRGIVHGAAVLDDSLLQAMSKESLDRVWAPKAEGALRLHHAGAAAELDWWIVFSSMAALLGSPGQAAYACASAWVDALVSWRAAKGLPAAAINWGPWSEVGLAQALTGSVLDPISPPEGIEALEALLASGRGRTGVARLRADRVIAAFPEIRGSGYFAQLVEEFDFADDGGDWAGPEVLRDCDPAEACKIVSERLRLRVAAIMGYADQSAADPAVPLVELGMDSLMAVRIRNTARADFGVEPPVALLLEGASLNDVTADLIRQLGFAAHDSNDRADEVRDRAQLRAAARQGAALRRKRGQRV